jgi:hypothetical protein
LVLAAAAMLVVAALGGLSAVLAVQRRANADLSAKNRELDDERAKVEKRFELAQKAIALFHTGVSEEALLQNAEFTELRTKLLKEAARFYADLEKLLAGQTDTKSRKALAAAYFQLAELTLKIGDKQRRWRSTARRWRCGGSWQPQKGRTWRPSWTWPAAWRRWVCC